MKIEDSFRINASPALVWAFIRDPGRVAPCVPGLEAVEIVSPSKYRAAVVVAVGPIKARFAVEIEIREEVAPSHILSTTRGEEGSRASVISAENVLRLTPVDDGTTEVFYSSEVSVIGRLGKFGLGVMKKKAKSLGEQFAATVRERLETPAGSPVGSPATGGHQEGKSAGHGIAGIP